MKDKLISILIIYLVVAIALLMPASFMLGREFGYARGYLDGDMPKKCEPVVVEKTTLVSPSVEVLIEYWADVWGIDVELAKRVAFCENGYKNGCNEDGCQYGQGIYQIIPSTWQSWTYGYNDMNVMDKNLNILFALSIAAVEGFEGHWAESMDCWK